MTTITIPENLIKEKELVIIPRREYEEFLHFRLKQIQEVELTSRQKQALVRARKNLSQGKFLTINELKQKLGFTN